MTTVIGGSSPSITFSDGTTQSTAANISAPYTANGVVYASSTSALATGSKFTWNGNTLSTYTYPNSWYASSTGSFQLSQFANFFQTTNGSVNLSFACYESAANTYAYSTTGDTPAFYNITGGTHVWYRATSAGTIGGTFTPTEGMRLDSSGNLLVGTTSTGNSNSKSFVASIANGYIVVNHLSGQASGSGYASFGYNGGEIGSITQSGTGNIALNGTSDRRLKSNIAQITTAQSGPIIDALKPSSFTWIADNKSDVGFIADEMQAVIPNAVLGQPNAVDAEGHPIYQQVNMTNQELIAYLVAEIQSLRARLKAANIA